MADFSSGQNPEGIRTIKWDDADYGLKGHLIRRGLGTSDTAMYPQAAADLLLGVLSDKGTQLQLTTADTGGIISCRNSLNGTVAIGDPVILDYSNSNGTTGYARSAYTTENLTAVAPSDLVHDTGTVLRPAKHGLVAKAVPGSIRMLAKVGNGIPAVLEEAGTTIVADGTHGFGTSTIAYTMDQPIIGFAVEQATTPRQLFRVDVSKQRYFKNNTVN